MSLDDVVLSLQRVMDRMIRWLRRGAAAERTHTRLLIVQIDGLSRLVLARVLASGECHPLTFRRDCLRHNEHHVPPERFLEELSAGSE